MEKIFNTEITLERLYALHNYGLNQTEPYWNLGYEKLTESFPALRNGLWFLVSPENIGKSSFLVNLGYNILTNNPGAFWLDFTLDDTVEDRYSYILARIGNIPIDLSKQITGASEEMIKKRDKVFGWFKKNISQRYRAIGVSSLSYSDDDVPTVEWITQVVGESRKEIGPGAKLFITIDGFHDIEVQEKTQDDNSKAARKSVILKRSANIDDALYLLTAHTRKDSRQRHLTADVLKGEGRILYDAKVITHVFSDVNLNKDGADVFWVDEAIPNSKMPVLEIDIMKNKAGSNKGMLFYHYIPSRCTLSEADEDAAGYYRGVIYGKKTKY